MFGRRRIPNRCSLIFALVAPGSSWQAPLFRSACDDEPRLGRRNSLSPERIAWSRTPGRDVHYHLSLVYLRPPRLSNESFASSLLPPRKDSAHPLRVRINNIARGALSTRAKGIYTLEYFL